MRVALNCQHRGRGTPGGVHLDSSDIKEKS